MQLKRLLNCDEGAIVAAKVIEWLEKYNAEFALFNIDDLTVENTSDFLIILAGIVIVLACKDIIIECIRELCSVLKQLIFAFIIIMVLNLLERYPATMSKLEQVEGMMKLLQKIKSKTELNPPTRAPDDE